MVIRRPAPWIRSTMTSSYQPVVLCIYISQCFVECAITSNLYCIFMLRLALPVQVRIICHIIYPFCLAVFNGVTPCASAEVKRRFLYQEHCLGLCPIATYVVRPGGFLFTHSFIHTFAYTHRSFMSALF